MAKILLCDDEPDIVKLVSGRLERAGHEVITAENGIDSIRLAVSEDPDLVVLDWMMPGLTGLEVCARLRKDPASSRKKVLMLTARAQEHDMQAAFDAGIDEYVIKPFRPAVLLDRVAALLART